MVCCLAHSLHFGRDVLSFILVGLSSLGNSSQIPVKRQDNFVFDAMDQRECVKLPLSLATMPRHEYIVHFDMDSGGHLGRLGDLLQWDSMLRNTD